MEAAKKSSPDIRCYLARVPGSNMARLTMLDVKAGTAAIVQGIAPWLPRCSAHVMRPPRPPIRPSGRLGHRIPLSSAPKAFLRKLTGLEAAGELTPGMEDELAGARLVMGFSGQAHKNDRCPEEILTEAT